jgi:hypothetical protein
MDVGGWISLLIGAGVLGSLACFVRMALRAGPDEWPFRPVWIVLLEGGTGGRDRPDDSHGGGDSRRPPRVPPRGGASGRPCRERRRRPSQRPHVARRGA